ncbi:hypothetical protein MHC_02010 [Mycoplasma haemocanis str. Illinois]|uniref:Uncharacterized protein n=1 Tax=Mycoplasma haemocanis (strain Illinois) TaxID=1111676 RepID=H6N6J6_MYCHN|nr:hypothetical protein [Mycoplasma haemocanis]AEW45268.1 hypothetical protein MHC_02010 [Mycoplasma haemocanis str. Illinois]
MSLSLSSKAVVSIAGVGVVSGGGAFVTYKFLTKNTIEKYLNSLHRELAISDEDWELIKNNYSSDKEESPISNIPKSSINSKLNDLKKWCRDNLNEEFSREKANKGGYNLIQSWCTKPVKISSYLKYLKLAALDTTGGGDDATWNKLKDAYPKGEGLKINEITNQDNNKKEGAIINSLSDSQKLKAWCSWSADQYFKHQEDSLFKRYKHFCTKQIIE